MVVDAQIEHEVGELRVPTVALDDHERRGLLPAPVAARALRGGQALQQPECEALSHRRLERDCERVDRLRSHEDVSLRRVAGSRAAARPVHARGAGVRRAVAVRVDDADLALVPAVVGVSEPLHDLLCA